MRDRFLDSAAIIFCAAALVVVILIAGCEGPQSAGSPGNTAGDTDEIGSDTDDLPSDPDPTLLQSTVFVDFDSAVAGVAPAAFDGSGIAAEPSDGQLDSDAFAFLGFSDGDLMFGDDGIAGDFARGSTSSGVSTGGLYAFTVTEDNIALGVQPTATDFAPGSILFRTEAPGKLIGCAVSSTIWSMNNEDRATAWSLCYSTDGETWSGTGSTPLTTAALAAEQPEWVSQTLDAEVSLVGSGAGPGDPFYLRWDSTDAGGIGSRDECAVDDLRLTFTYTGE